MGSFSNCVVGSQTVLIEMDGVGLLMPFLYVLDQSLFFSLCDLLLQGTEILADRYTSSDGVIHRVLTEPLRSLRVSQVIGVLLSFGP